MTMLCSSRASQHALRTQLPIGIASIITRTYIWQARPTRSQHTLTRSSSSKPYSSLFRPFNTIYVNRERVLSLTCFSASIQRGYATSSKSRIRKLGRFAVNLTVIFGLGLIIWTGAEAWYYLNPPQFDEWPEQLREHLMQARTERIRGARDAEMEHFRRAWTSIRNIPTHMLNPQPAIKIFSVAIWLADCLEKDGQIYKAYDVLSDAIALHQARFGKAATTEPSSGSHADVFGSANVTERRYLISVLAKLANLSEKCEANAEGKWMSHAIREMTSLLPYCKALSMERYSRLISDVQRLSAFDPSLSHMSLDLTRPATDSLGLVPPTDNFNFNPNILEEEVAPADEVLFLPYWFLPDVASAIAIPLEQVGIYAAKHGNSYLAYASYEAATDTVLKTLASKGIKKNATIGAWETLIHSLQIVNHRTDLILRQLELETHPTEWLYYLHQACREDSLAMYLTMQVANLTKVKSSSEWRSQNLKVRDTFQEAVTQSILCLKHGAICFEKFGILHRAMVNYEDCLTLLTFLDEHPGKVKEKREIQERISNLKQSIAEGKTSIESQMSPMALMEWEEMKGKSKADADGGTRLDS